MKYSQPFGIVDPDGHYVNGNPQTGIQGSIPPASAFEEPQRELVNLIIQSDISPEEDDLYQVSKAVRSQFLNVARDTSATANTLVVAYSPPIQTYTLGLPLRVVVAHTNTGNATINAGPGLAQLVRTDGSELQAGDVKAGGIATLIFDGTRFQLQNFLGAVSGGSANYYIKIPYVADTSPVSNAILAMFSPAISAVLPGDIILVKLANVTTGSTTINVNGIPIAPVTRPDQNPLGPGDGVPGHVMLLVWDGSRWQFMNPRYASLQTGFQKYEVGGVYTFTVPTGVYHLIRVRLWGAGGGGGAGYPYGPTGVTGGGGGAAGGYSELLGLNVSPGQIITVTVGGGGAGTPAYVWATGGAGGTSSFGGFMSCTGGGGGGSGYASSLGVGGVAGVGTGGTNNYPGGAGEVGEYSTPMIYYSAGGSGGAPPMIGVHEEGSTGSSAPSAKHSGGGGCGGYGINTTGYSGGGYISYAGHAGAPGRCEIEWRV